MSCRPFTVGPGVSGFQCGRASDRPTCSAANCSKPAIARCAYVLKTGKPCDRPLCRAHALELGREQRRCGPHARLEVAK